EHDRDADVELRTAWVREDLVQLRERDQRRCAAADAVEQRHPLRHRRHLHASRRHGPEAASDQHAQRERPPARAAGLDPRHDDREEHPERADLVAAPRMRGVGEEAQREDERDDRDQVEQVREVRAHSPLLPSPGASGSFGASRFLNISSIRSVTTKPPTTFAEPSTTARKPTTQPKAPLCGEPRTAIAPTTTIPWIALVPDISGVCSRVGTFEITSKPRKIASTRIVTSKTSSVLWLTPCLPGTRRSGPRGGTPHPGWGLLSRRPL